MAVSTRRGKPRVPPKAVYAPLDHVPAVHLRPIMLQTCRGDGRLSLDEARELIADLTSAYYAAIQDEAAKAHAAAHGPPPEAP